MAGAGDIRAGRAFVELFVRDNLSKDLAAISAKLQAFGAAVAGIGRQALLAGGGILAGLGGAVKVFSDTGSHLQDLSLRTGVGVESLSSLGFAAEHAGLSAESLEHSFRHLARGIQEAAEGSGSAGKALVMLGLNLQELQGLAPDEQFRRIGAALGGLADPSQRAALAMEIFGRAGTELLPLFAEGADGLARLEARARELGVVFSGPEAKAAKEFSNALVDLWAVVKMGVAQVGAALVPELKQVVAWVTTGAQVVVRFVRENRALILAVAGVAAGIAGVGAVLIAVGGAVSLADAAFAALATVVGVVVSVAEAIGGAMAFLVSPLGLVVVAVVAAGAAILYFSGAAGRALADLGQSFRWVKEVGVEAWGGIRDALAAGDLGLAARVAWAAVKVAVLENTQGIQVAWVNVSSFFQGVWARIVAYGKMAWVTLKAFALEWFFSQMEQWQQLTAAAGAAWAKIVAFAKPTVNVLGALWERLFNDIIKGWRLVAKFAADAWRPVLKGAAAIGNVAAGQALKDYDRAYGGAEKTPVAHVARANEAAAGERGQIADQLQKDLAQIEADRQRRLGEIDPGLAAARKELADALAEARNAAEAARGKGPARAAGLPRAAEAAFATGKVDVQGTFSALAVGGLGSKRVIDQIAETERDQLKELRQINKKLDGQGLKVT